jgi:hypothetical protein
LWSPAAACAIFPRRGLRGHNVLIRLRHGARGLAARACLTALLVLAAAAALPQRTHAAACRLPDSRPLWIEYGDYSVPFRNELFGKPGVVAAVSKVLTAQELRRRGAGTVYWDMYLNGRVGTPWDPADPRSIAARADRLYRHAVSVTGCPTPLIAFNELFGAQLRTPWSTTNSQYRRNVLTLLRSVASRGARPFLLVSHRPATAGEAGHWWREAAAVSTFVREMYVPAPQVAEWGPALGHFYLRRIMGRAVRQFTRIGIPAGRVGFILGFHTKPGTGGRDGLEPARAWFEVVKLEALAARRVATALGVPTIWSWGWQSWTGRIDADKRAAACVYLWTRDPALCDGPAAAGPGFDAALIPPPLRRPHVRLAAHPVGGGLARVRIAAGRPFARHTLYLQRRIAPGRWEAFARVQIGANGSARIRVRLPFGWSALRVVRSRSQTGSLYAGKLGPVRFVRIR